MMKQQFKRYSFLALTAALLLSWEPALAQRKKKEKAPPVKTEISNYTTVEETKPTTKEYKYETAQNDPLNARIYTLANGMKVYMTVYKDAPRIQTYIAVRAGSK